jgi:flavin reductase (DIM6/NTAB) family NADH-FMN oxidoreductase RutF
VEASPANLECRVLRIVEIEPEFPGETPSTVIMGRVLGLHIQEGYLDSEGRFDTVKAQPTTRLGGYQYATVGQVVEMPAPFERSA